ncbi:NADH dehydrogenase [ubiquinone] 1 alpha subcomplex assembly factor 3-like isoform X3 [Amphibalanus amphitrite]|uniref:NADH dehydrogenase [ubiquinone] 1 alpha subcomplex assembly factor 3-like isoform X3 n=2 Tax=Amphibalanus amphitrite TaxID=1232801 RepID=UPI001C90383D|nr:NADH dehydrogenase [ubiquinone] 1 alpha subcomplex assembly factor 3-like isoform X3 [Amphibalanus amphitrite]XP_043224167.1 NADH dehydrogenase [ubiquinone] 1 alpha subcomplex assembly factor 3-like isoform X3 [Amphibalanus amphitrite]XP_043224168.1 NADH dehydrogenase [ubiquinone] 1 alpha subcomplex assembly factor 3-like isoform X3 [Amphibalanus amphitrite]XP_043224169.1 NADH dehydrogenase [ubiquinone] 1 alpha subcomplex assembly factor 3-like isoform X3 [Amphibalanus amphitrite]XP_04322417
MMLSRWKSFSSCIYGAAKQSVCSSVKTRGLSVTPQRLEYSEHNEDQKTTVTFLNREMGDMISVDGISQYGFHLNSGVVVLGPMAVFPRTVLGWNVPSASHITPASLALFAILEPRLDCLVIGTGDRGTTVSKEVIAFLRQKKISFEILPTEQAAATFNFMNLERRCVAGALIPPVDVRLVDRDYEQHQKSQRQALLEEP